MKYFLILLLTVNVAFGQQVVTVKYPAVFDTVANTLTTDLIPISNSLATVNTQIAAVNSQIGNLKTTDASLQQQITNIVVPVGAGVPKPINKASSFTLSDTCFNRTIWMNCSGCTVTIPPIFEGFKCSVQSLLGTVSFKASNVSFFTVPASMTKNSRAVTIDFQTSNKVNVK